MNMFRQLTIWFLCLISIIPVEGEWLYISPVNNIFHIFFLFFYFHLLFVLERFMKLQIFSFVFNFLFVLERFMNLQMYIFFILFFLFIVSLQQYCLRTQTVYASFLKEVTLTPSLPKLPSTLHYIDSIHSHWYLLCKILLHSIENWNGN